MEHTSFRLVRKIEITLVELRHEIGQTSRGTQDARKRESLIPARRTRYHVLIDRIATGVLAPVTGVVEIRSEALPPKRAKHWSNFRTELYTVVDLDIYKDFLRKRIY